MSKRLFFIFSIIFSIIILLSAYQPTSKKELTDAQRQEIANTIRQRNQEFIDQWKKMNHERFNKFTDDFLVESNEPSWMSNPALMVFNLNILPTKEKFKESWRATIDKNPSYNMKTIEDYVSVISENLAIYVGKFNYSITDSLGNTGKEHTAINTTVYINKNGKWKMLHNHQSWQ
jgi:ketosteroid isomerase-like protein